MKITDYVINIKDSSLQDRLRLRQVLLDNGQKIHFTQSLIEQDHRPIYGYNVSISEWTMLANSTKPNIELKDFIQKFKKHDQIRNLAFYKRSKEPWLQGELNKIYRFTKPEGGVGTSGHQCKYNYDNGYGGAFQHTWFIQNKTCIENCLQIAYEDVFPQKQPNLAPIGNKVTDDDKVLTTTSCDINEAWEPDLEGGTNPKFYKEFFNSPITLEKLREVAIEGDIAKCIAPHTVSTYISELPKIGQQYRILYRCSNPNDAAEPMTIEIDNHPCTIQKREAETSDSLWEIVNRQVDDVFASDMNNIALPLTDIISTLNDSCNLDKEESMNNDKIDHAPEPDDWGQVYLKKGVDSTNCTSDSKTQTVESALASYLAAEQSAILNNFKNKDILCQ